MSNYTHFSETGNRQSLIIKPAEVFDVLLNNVFVLSLCSSARLRHPACFGEEIGLFIGPLNLDRITLHFSTPVGVNGDASPRLGKHFWKPEFQSLDDTHTYLIHQ